MLVNICNTLAEGLTHPWIPPPQSKDAVDPQAAVVESPTPKKPGRPTPAASKSKPTVAVPISPDATPDLKTAVEVTYSFSKLDEN